MVFWCLMILCGLWPIPSSESDDWSSPVDFSFNGATVAESYGLPHLSNPHIPDLLQKKLLGCIDVKPVLRRITRSTTKGYKFANHSDA